MKKSIACLALAALLSLAGCGQRAAKAEPAALDSSETIALLEQFVQWHEAFLISWDRGAHIEIELWQGGKPVQTGVSGIAHPSGECRVAFAVMEGRTQGDAAFAVAVAQLEAGHSMHTFLARDVDISGARFDLAAEPTGELGSGARAPLYGVYYRDDPQLPDDPDLIAQAQDAAVAILFYLYIQ